MRAKAAEVGETTCRAGDDAQEGRDTVDDAVLDEEADRDEDESDEEENLDMAADENAPAQMQVDFAFFDPRETDFHGVRTLLAGSGLVPSAWDVGGMAGLIVDQVEVGSMVKTASPDSDAPAEDDVLGFISAINLRKHRGAKCVQQITASVLQRASDPQGRQAIEKMLDDSSQAIALIVYERMLNMPPALVPHLLDALLQDIEWALTNAPQEERASFHFTRFFLLAQVTLPAGGADALGSRAGTSLEQRAPGGKKRKKIAAEGQAMLMESLEYFRPEEQLLASSADFSVLLNGTGRSRQVLMALTPAALREAIPGLTAMMVE
eukprot:CAMPEP_0195578478 /NCGR_PEP_ID=MMETSP0814-20130614/12156_1 /TAXON_ID=97485 /ORGANISM="Prymnesium parvum, Strain Texoma1" /LENGTH=321 /DNA_ID=CAMNT_0040715017 /DNA_START=17 /DNA_END=982 /DNA_ORIENTATION=+